MREDINADRWHRYGRHDTVSSVSSDGDFGDRDGSDLESERTDEITRISAELRSKVDAMAKSINTDRGIGAADRSLVGIFYSECCLDFRTRLHPLKCTFHDGRVVVGHTGTN